MSKAWHFDTAHGYQGYFLKSGSGDFYALAVRDGDVSAVPEVQTPVLLLGGLGALAWLRKRPARA